MHKHTDEQTAKETDRRTERGRQGEYRILRSEPIAAWKTSVAWDSEKRPVEGRDGLLDAARI